PGLVEDLPPLGDGIDAHADGVNRKATGRWVDLASGRDDRPGVTIDVEQLLAVVRQREPVDAWQHGLDLARRERELLQRAALVCAFQEEQLPGHAGAQVGDLAA